MVGRCAGVELSGSEMHSMSKSQVPLQTEGQSSNCTPQTLVTGSNGFHLWAGRFHFCLIMSSSSSVVRMHPSTLQLSGELPVGGNRNVDALSLSMPQCLGHESFDQIKPQKRAGKRAQLIRSLLLHKQKDLYLSPTPL